MSQANSETSTPRDSARFYHADHFLDSLNSRMIRGFDVSDSRKPASFEMNRNRKSGPIRSSVIGPANTKGSLSITNRFCALACGINDWNGMIFSAIGPLFAFVFFIALDYLDSVRSQ